MNPSIAYRQQQAMGWTRIEMLLALYGGAIDRLEQAAVAMDRNDPAAAQPHLLRAHRMVMELLAGVDMKYGELPQQFARLYEHVLWSVGQATAPHVKSAIGVLKTLREGLSEVRDQAVELERLGEIPPVHANALSQAV